MEFVTAIITKVSKDGWNFYIWKKEILPKFYPIQKIPADSYPANADIRFNRIWFYTHFQKYKVLRSLYKVFSTACYPYSFIGPQRYKLAVLHCNYNYK